MGSESYHMFQPMMSLFPRAICFIRLWDSHVSHAPALLVGCQQHGRNQILLQFMLSELCQPLALPRFSPPLHSGHRYISPVVVDHSGLGTLRWNGFLWLTCYRPRKKNIYVSIYVWMNFIIFMWKWKYTWFSWMEIYIITFIRTCTSKNVHVHVCMYLLRLGVVAVVGIEWHPVVYTYLVLLS